jgi:hypothetical protein
MIDLLDCESKLKPEKTLRNRWETNHAPAHAPANSLRFCKRKQKKFVSTQMAYNCLSLHFMGPRHLFPDETSPAAADSTYPVSLPRAFSGRLGRGTVRKETSAAHSIPSLEMSCSFSKFSTLFLFATSDFLRVVALPITNRNIPNNPWSSRMWTHNPL